MNDPKTQQEPSMEEILASIRRIISEDDAEPEDGQDAAPEETDEAPPAEAEEDAPADESPADQPPGDEPEADVLDLTEAVDDDYDMALTDETDIVEVMEVEDEPEPEPEPEPFEEEPAPPPVDPAPPPPRDDSLISPPPSAEATSQFSVLAAAVAGDRLGQTMGVGARTIEDLVKEVMRPMIKEWLDAHLPSLVERLVGREIDRMARRAEDDTDD